MDGLFGFDMEFQRKRKEENKRRILSTTREERSRKTGFFDRLKQGEVRFHGQYGGPGYSGGKTNISSNLIPVEDYKNVRPSDKLDQLFKIHDIRYELAETKEDIMEADKLYIAEFNQIKSQLNPNLLAKGYGAEKAFQLKLNFPFISYSDPINNRSEEEKEFLRNEKDQEYSLLEEENPILQGMRDKLSIFDETGTNLFADSIPTIAGSIASGVKETFPEFSIMAGERTILNTPERRDLVRQYADKYLTQQSPVFNQIKDPEIPKKYIQPIIEEQINLIENEPTDELDEEPEPEIINDVIKPEITGQTESSFIFDEQEIINFIIDDDD